MITYFNEWNVELRGLSTDVKPTKYVGNGSLFIEMDTGKAFVFDKENCKWLEV